jgi:hypothetical protein
MRAAALAGLLLLAPEALALMPPHVSHTEPASGSSLVGNTIIFHGYSLEYAESQDVVVVDPATGRAVEHSTELDCQWEGEDPPGHVGGTQLRCELRVTLEGLEAGRLYKASYMDTELEFTWVGPAPAQPAPAPEQNPAPAGDPAPAPAEE